MIDSISEIRLKDLMPAFADKVRTLMLMLSGESINTRVVQALRSWSDQDKLYAQGRTAPGSIVTNVQGGYSWHNYGLAVDLVPSLPGDTYIPDWNKDHATWKRMIQLGPTLGLESGAAWRTFPDAPHFQLNGRFPVGAPDDEVRQLFKDGGMAAVWDEVMKSLA